VDKNKLDTGQDNVLKIQIRYELALFKTLVFIPSTLRGSQVRESPKLRSQGRGGREVGGAPIGERGEVQGRTQGAKEHHRGVECFAGMKTKRFKVSRLVFEP
jgi:hypothetical protein